MGDERAVALEYGRNGKVLNALALPDPDPEAPTEETNKLVDQTCELLTELPWRFLTALGHEPLINTIRRESNTANSSDFADFVAFMLSAANKISAQDAQTLFETFSPERRLRFLNSLLGDHVDTHRDLRQITPLLIEEFKSSLLREKTRRDTIRKGATVNRYLQLLSKVFSMAYFNGLVDNNPCRRVRKEREGGRRERYLTHQEEERLMKALTGNLAYLRPAVVVALGTGMRKAELLSLRFEQINFGQLPVFYPVNGKEVELRPNWLLVADSKTGKPRTIPMNPVVRETLLGLARDTGAEQEVFSYSRNGVSDMTIRKGFKKVCEAAEIPYGQIAASGLVWHDLRHTFATRLREEGVHELDIMQLMGHSSVKMTASYAHSTHRVLQESVNKLTEKRGELVEFSRKVG